MLGQLIETLDDPATAHGLMAALDDPVLTKRLTTAAAAVGETPAVLLATTVREFLEKASDDHWVQLVGIMGRSSTPGLAALRAVLAKALPAGGG
jgi:hypothetical protein